MIEILTDAGKTYPQPYHLSKNSCSSNAVLVLQRAGFTPPIIGRVHQIPKLLFEWFKQQ
ncbi:hypothetical protein [Hugenholtzia roseola]|uniref:hypothetical protein n=1 Tax=Hugenholtzia roseola TaxID=1002 RepID=UPI0004207797|nr:hypothetical protein [Hugenholtzia roseola]